MHELDRVIANLRHAYAQLASESVFKQKLFADGLIAPAIEELEKLAHHPDRKEAIARMAAEAQKLKLP